MFSHVHAGRSNVRFMTVARLIKPAEQLTPAKLKNAMLVVYEASAP